MIGPLWSLGVLLGAAGLLWEGVARMGAGLGAFWRARPGGAMERFGIGLLLGWSVLGVAFLGLALTGLYLPAVLLLSLAGMAGGTRSFLNRTSFLMEAGREGGMVYGRGLIPLLLGAAPVAIFLCLPETEWDCLVYHLGAPWQYLQAHRAVFSRLPGGFSLPLPTEMSYALPLVLGDERLAKWIVASYVVAATSLYLGQRGRDGRTAGGWLGPLLMCAAGESIALATTSKNDLAATSLVVSGILLVRRQGWLAGSLLLGLGIAAKPVYVPLVGLWCLLQGRRNLPWVGAALGMGLPSVPWLLKAWCVTANVGVPTGWLSSKSIWLKATPVAGGVGFPDTWVNRDVPMLDAGELVHLPQHWLAMLGRDHLPILLVLPGLVWLGRCRRGLAACLLAQAIVLELLDTPRFLLPALWVMTLLAAEEMPRVSPRLRGPATALATCYALLQIWLAPGLRWRTAGDAMRPMAIVRDERFSVFGGMLAALPPAGRGRIMLVGEPRVYRIPGRAIYEGNRAEAPLLWKLAHDSLDPESFARRWRQTGVSLVAYNFVAANYHLIASPQFAWTPRMVVLYRSAVRRHLRVIAPPRTASVRGGGYVVYAWDPAGHPGRSALPYLPGTEHLLSPAAELAQQGDYAGAAALLRSLCTVYPDVGRLHSALGDMLWLQGKAESALIEYRSAGASGLVDLANWFQLGASAEVAGRVEESLRAYAAARALYPDLRAVTDQRIATLEFGRGEAAAAGRRWIEAETRYRASLAALTSVPESTARTESSTVARVRLAGALLRQGRRAEAVEQIDLARAAVPGLLRHPEVAEIWREAGAPPSR